MANDKIKLSSLVAGRGPDRGILDKITTQQRMKQAWSKVIGNVDPATITDAVEDTLDVGNAWTNSETVDQLQPVVTPDESITESDHASFQDFLLGDD